MSTYSLVVSLHVVLAILGLGPLVATALVASLQRDDDERRALVRPIGALLRVGQASLGLLLITGIAIDLVASGALHGAGWFRASVGLLLFTGFSIFQARRALRRVDLRRAGEDGEDPWQALATWAWFAVGGVAGIAVLMEGKPF